MLAGVADDERVALVRQLVDDALDEGAVLVRVEAGDRLVPHLRRWVGEGRTAFDGDRGDGAEAAHHALDEAGHALCGDDLVGRNAGAGGGLRGDLPVVVAKAELLRDLAGDVEATGSGLHGQRDYVSGHSCLLFLLSPSERRLI